MGFSEQKLKCSTQIVGSKGNDALTIACAIELEKAFGAVVRTSIVNILGLPSVYCPMGFSEQKLPYGIQIVGSKGNDALTIACAVELEKAFGGWKLPGEV
ncbi:hypothetical protein AVEN_33772-1 [Araneus ventricosus]|uniref:Uncharacterized protein n=1 Tax=Araneus ventricosus TaxID=182803 RepID=A0A4Y2RC67_ARAVE|nr:hypothetical protein AVEN_33772-1 [Araneus ventricosus]